MIRWLQVLAIGLVTSAVSLLLAFASGNVLINWRLQSTVAISIALVVVVVANLAAYLLAFWSITRALLGSFSARYWAVPGCILLLLVLSCFWLIENLHILSELPPGERSFARYARCATNGARLGRPCHAVARAPQRGRQAARGARHLWAYFASSA
jgi:hypothetical protein